jgi:hypothetical protein
MGKPNENPHQNLREKHLGCPTVHSALDHHGFIPMLVALARTNGFAGYVGEGAARWPAVHTLEGAGEGPSGTASPVRPESSQPFAPYALVRWREYTPSIPPVDKIAWQDDSVTSNLMKDLSTVFVEALDIDKLRRFAQQYSVFAQWPGPCERSPYNRTITVPAGQFLAEAFIVEPSEVGTHF